MPLRSVSAQQVKRLLGSTEFATPVYRDLADRLRLLIVDGRLTDGSRLPSERDFAHLLRLSRSTVTSAYVRLRELGYLHTRQGSGNYVSLPERQRTNTQLPGGERDESGAISFAYASGPALPGLAGAYRAATERLPSLLAGHGYYPDGIEELRQALAEWYTQRGLTTTADQLVITAGALSALNIVAQTVLSPGDRALVESPSYPNALDVLRQRARPVPYPLSPTGWEPRDFELTLRQSAPRLSYLIPDFHNPTAAWMSEEIRPEVAAALRRYRSTAVIDETLVELSLDDEPMRTPLAAYLPDAITIGSASKAFWGGLRIGWIRAPRPLVRPLLETRALLDIGTAPFEQLVLAELLADSQAFLTAQRERLRIQRDRLLAELAAALPGWTADSPAGGLSLWVTLPDESSTRLAALAERHHLVLTAGPRFFTDGGGERQLRLPYTAEPEVLADAVQRLAALWADLDSSGHGRPRSAALGLTA
ncbi:MAG: PLP-dependent aminotransferase family protein [Propionibacteriaceae bacterium]